MDLSCDQEKQVFCWSLKLGETEQGTFGFQLVQCAKCKHALQRHSEERSVPLEQLLYWPVSGLFKSPLCSWATRWTCSRVGAGGTRGVAP